MFDQKEVGKRNICLVDHNQVTQMAPGVDVTKIVGIIDHHALQSKIVTTATPIFIDIRPWGSACTIVASMFIDHGKAISQKTAGLLLSGILSDTLNLQSPTTTEVCYLLFFYYLFQLYISRCC